MSDARSRQKTARTGRAEGVSLTRTRGETNCRLFPVHRLHKSSERLHSGTNAQVGGFTDRGQRQISRNDSAPGAVMLGLNSTTSKLAHPLLPARDLVFKPQRSLRRPCNRR